MLNGMEDDRVVRR